MVAALQSYKTPPANLRLISEQITDNPRARKALFDLFTDVNGALPDNIQSSIDTANAAQQAADAANLLAQQAESHAQQALTNAASALSAATAAQAAANAAQITANAAKAEADAINADYVSITKTSDQTLSGSLGVVSLKIAGLQVVGSRITGWTAFTGSPYYGAFNANTTYTVSASYTQSEIQSIAAALTQARQRIAALEQSMRTQGTIN